MLIIIIIVIVVVVNNDTYYWIYLFSHQPFQVYYKVRQVFLQSATSVIKKCDDVITKCDRCYKMRRLLQSATEHGVHVHYLLHSIWFSMTFKSQNYAISYGDHDLILFSFLNCLFFPSIQDEAWNSYWIRDQRRLVKFTAYKSTIAFFPRFHSLLAVIMILDWEKRLRRNPPGNWVVSIFRGQKPCTKIIKRVLHFFFTFFKSWICN